MNIISWNVNGLRALQKKGQWDWLMKKNPDVICLQETKSRPEQLPENLFDSEKYKSYFSWPKDKKGYSGVAIYTKREPQHVEESIKIGNKEDREGRVLTAYYDDFVLLNVYFPNGGGGPERLKYKLQFYKSFLKHVESIRKVEPNILFCGDINTAHKETDLARPKENQKNTGFLPEERAWIDEVIKAEYIDVFRSFYPNKKDVYTYWDMKTFARDRNVGWRIDYFFASTEIISRVRSIKIHTEIRGSDHCPLELNMT